MVFFSSENILIYQTQILFTDQIQNNSPYSSLFARKKAFFFQEKSITKWEGCQRQTQKAKESNNINKIENKWLHN